MAQIKKKIISIYSFFIKFFKDFLPQIVFLVFISQLLIAMGGWPYLNIISKYYFYAFAIVWILSNFLFKKYITNKGILIMGISMFILAIPVVILELNFLSDVLGFAAFVFLSTYVVREIIYQRDSIS